MRFDTKLVHVGQEPEPGAGGVVPPIHVACTYERRIQDPMHYFYSRGENPTREGLERCLAALEDAQFATMFASGQAAAATALSLLTPGQRVISSDDIYGGTHALFAMLGRYGIEVDYVDLTDIERLREALTDDVGLVWVETPTNPLLKITDLRAVCRLAHERHVLVLVDNTFSSPVLQQPLQCGADISLYSTTKFIAGHSDVLGGALVYHDEQLNRRFTAYRTAAGNVLGAIDCFLTHRGLKTLSLRMARQVSNAEAIVAVLRGASSVGTIHYPGLPEHPQHEVAMRQMAGPGAIVTFEYFGVQEKLLDRLQVFAYAVSLGGVRSLIECPALMTHRSLPRQTRLALGISDNLIRLSAGIEDPEDLVEDLMGAL
jgi:cystathionine beta-lyase/cystathionine gamma-synthase